MDHAEKGDGGNDEFADCVHFGFGKKIENLEKFVFVERRLEVE